MVGRKPDGTRCHEPDDTGGELMDELGVKPSSHGAGPMLRFRYTNNTDAAFAAHAPLLYRSFIAPAAEEETEATLCLPANRPNEQIVSLFSLFHHPDDGPCGEPLLRTRFAALDDVTIVSDPSCAE